MRLRSQLPGNSPVTAPALARSLARAVARPDSAREELRDILAARFRGSPILVGSGTQALQMALAAAASHPAFQGRAVAVPAYSCYDIVTACAGAGVRAAFYDIDPSTLGPTPGSVEALLEEGVRVVVAGNLYGFPLDWDGLRRAVDAVDGLLLEDCAQGVGGRWGERPAGTLGDATVLSFGRGKGWTGGGGGALVVREERLRGALPEPAGRPWGLRSVVGSVAHWALGRPSLYGIPQSIPGLGLGQTVYKMPCPPGPITTTSAALVLATADLAQAEVHARRRVAARWIESIPEGPWRLPRPHPGGTASYLRLPLLAATAPIREGLLIALSRFGAAPGYPEALPDIPEAEAIADSPQQRILHGARSLAARLLTLPTHGLVTERDMQEVVGILGGFSARAG